MRLLLEVGEAVRDRLVVLVRGVLVQSRCPSGRQESLEADLALNRLRLLVDLELRLGGAAGKLCVALALLRSLGSVSTTHFVLCVLERKGEAVGCKLVLAQRTRFIVELGVCRGVRTPRTE